MDFAAPDSLWLALAAPLVMALAAYCWRRRRAATAAWAARGLWKRLLPGYAPRRQLLSALLLALAVLGAALALARPRWGESEQQVERQGVDVVFVLDTSLSMAAKDVQPDRLWVAQTLVRQLVRALPGHRLALVQAEGDGVVMVPLTTDAAVIDLQLDAVRPGTLPTPGTELASALNKALDLYPEGSEKHRVMVLISDGEDHGSDLRKAGERLRESGTVLHAIGVGTPEGLPLELPAEGFGRSPEYKRDQQGNVVISRLKEETMETLTRTTQGIYLRATSAAADPAQIIERVRSMETRSLGSETFATLEERFQWPTLAAVLALLLHLTVAPFRRVEGES